VATLKKQKHAVWFSWRRTKGGFAKKKNADFQFYSTVQFMREFLLK